MTIFALLGAMLSRARSPSTVKMTGGSTDPSPQTPAKRISLNEVIEIRTLGCSLCKSLSNNLVSERKIEYQTTQWGAVKVRARSARRVRPHIATFTGKLGNIHKNNFAERNFGIFDDISRIHYELIGGGWVARVEKATLLSRNELRRETKTSHILRDPLRTHTDAKFFEHPSLDGLDGNDLLPRSPVKYSSAEETFLTFSEEFLAFRWTSRYIKLSGTFKISPSRESILVRCVEAAFSAHRNAWHDLGSVPLRPQNTQTLLFKRKRISLRRVYLFALHFDTNALSIRAAKQ